jgi:hypothetical protein
MDLNEKLNFILSKCWTIRYPGDGVVSVKDLKQSLAYIETSKKNW